MTGGPQTTVIVHGRYKTHAVFWPRIPFSQSQHAGPKLATYSTGSPTTAASVHFAHRPRRFTIRTVSQTQNAAKATARMVRRMIITVSGTNSYSPPRRAWLRRRKSRRDRYRELRAPTGPERPGRQWFQSVPRTKRTDE